MSEVRLSVEPRTEFGKGAARRTRRAGKIPAVLYGHGTDPRHLSLPALEFARVVRENGSNAVLTLDIDNSAELALTKTIVIHPLRNYIEHVDLLVVKRGEKITVEVPLVITGDPRSGSLVTVNMDTVQIEVDALNIPEQFEVSIASAGPGTMVTAAQIELPSGAVLVTDPEALVVAVNESPSESAMESDVDAAGAGVVEEKPDAAE